MLRKEIIYVDFNEVERKENFYFNLTKAEVMEMELSKSGGFAEMITNVIAAQDIPAIIKIFKDLILKAYGEKSPDGRKFIKNKEITEAFSQTEAYSNLFMELATDATSAASFVNGITPSITPVTQQIK